jgi:hypothetical protein
VDRLGTFVSISTVLHIFPRFSTPFPRMGIQTGWPERTIFRLSGFLKEVVLKITKVAEIFGHFLQKYMGQHFRIFFHTLNWSPWIQIKWIWMCRKYHQLIRLGYLRNMFKNIWTSFFEFLNSALTRPYTAGYVPTIFCSLGHFYQHGLPSGVKFAPRGEHVPQGWTLSPREHPFVHPQGWTISTF